MTPHDQDTPPGPPAGARSGAWRPGDRFRRLYGEEPLHLLILIVSFAVCGYAAFRWLSRDWLSIAVWFVGAAVLHDLVLVPLYAGTDWILHRAAGRRGRTPHDPPRTAVNHIRVPAFVSLLLLLVYWPLVLRNAPHYSVSTHLPDTVFLRRWLLITAVLFGASAVWYAVGRYRTRPRGHTAPKER